MTNNLTKIEDPALGCLMGAAYQKLLKELSDELKKAGLTISTGEYLVLRALYADDGIQQCEIAEKTGKDKAAISRLIAGLKKEGYVSTISVSHKCLRVFLTDKSRKIHSKIMNVAMERHAKLVNMTTPDELEIFTKILNNILKQK